jgi:hypothetical protein
MWCGVAWWMPLVFTAPLVIFFCLTSVTISVSVCSFLAVWDCGCLPLVGIVFFYRAVEQGEKKGRVIIVGVGFPRAWRWVGLGNWVKQRGKSQRFVVLKHVAGRLC